MAATPGNNDYLPFAIGTGSNVQDQADYAANPAVTVGYGTGTAISNYMNKTWRQGSIGMALLGEYISKAGYDANDDGNVAALVANFQSALETIFIPTIVFAGNPNGNVAGIASISGLPPMQCWDIVNNIMWICTTTGNSTTAVWQQSGRQRLTANLILYVSALGSDLNNGLSSSTPFQTIQRAVTLVQNLDFNGFSVTINIITGIYSAGAIVSGSLVGAPAFPSLQFVTSGGPVTINGQGYCFAGELGAGFNINGAFTLNCVNVATSVNACVSAADGARVGIAGSGVNFGTSQFAHILASSGGEVTNQPASAFTISGSSPTSWRAETQGIVVVQESATITLAGSPTFTDFALCYDNSSIECGGLTFGGSGAIGARYQVYNDSIINTGGAGASYLPGNTAGTANGATGGFYV